jgi:hypothetical protein
MIAAQYGHKEIVSLILQRMEAIRKDPTLVTGLSATKSSGKKEAKKKDKKPKKKSKGSDDEGDEEMDGCVFVCLFVYLFVYFNCLCLFIIMVFILIGCSF